MPHHHFSLIQTPSHSSPFSAHWPSLSILYLLCLTSLPYYVSVDSINPLKRSYPSSHYYSPNQHFFPSTSSNHPSRFQLPHQASSHDVPMSVHILACPSQFPKRYLRSAWPISCQCLPILYPHHHHQPFNYMLIMIFK
ncbi:hypothetical protein BpHYR1_028577 [Brachionus plicatilis]|uniref:Uncharacterized protein n=1 Tax=Brachionus plicatilis TaxID=10195 RepID=A0A3M7QTN1_BRAPC|nr:hypothetical protein BpHYR1_028577 [Brachionus plicatilis]